MAFRAFKKLSMSATWWKNFRRNKKERNNFMKINKFIYWTPRILGIIFILFLMIFSLDVFEPGLTVWQIIIGLFMHNIPALLLLIVLIISWKYEIVGGIIFNLAGLLYILMLFMNSNFQLYMLSWSLIIAGPAFLIGILFLINCFKKKSV
jgi:hypothetical protein